MPAKGSIGKYHGRHVFISRKLWKKYLKESGSNITYTEFCAIVKGNMEELQKWVLKEPIGFKLPFKLGNIAVNRLKTYGEFKTWTGLRTADGKPIRAFNLHTQGDTFRIQLFHNTRSAKDVFSFWFLDAERKFKRSLAKVLKSDNYPLYNTFMQDQFVITR